MFHMEILKLGFPFFEFSKYLCLYFLFLVFYTVKTHGTTVAVACRWKSDVGPRSMKNPTCAVNATVLVVC